MASLTRREFSQRLTVVSAAAAIATCPAHAQSGSARASAGSLTDVPGIRVGHFTDRRRPTGCTAILFDVPATAGADYATSAPGEMLGVLLQPVSPVERIHGLLLTGGGPMGLGAVAGAVRHLEARGTGYDWGVQHVRIPLVVGAVIDDLALGDGRIRPDADAAERACAAASTDPVAEGSVGVGTGATVGKMFRARGLAGMKGGLGTASLRRGDLVVAALAVVNAAGDIIDHRTGRIVAGARRADGSGFADSARLLRDGFNAEPAASRPLDDAPLHSTTLTVVATNLAMDKTKLTKLAMMTNTGASRAINPYHTEGDGDQLYAISTERVVRDIPVTVVAAIACDLVATAIVRAVAQATGVEGWKAVRDL